MPNPYVNKVVQSNGTTLIDISDTTAVASDVASGKYFYLATGEKVAGTSSGGGTPAISVVDTPDSHGGTIREITALDISDTTAVASDVAQGKYFYTAAGVKTAGSASGGGTPSATAHTIYFEFSDNTNTTITAYWDDSFISDAITETVPATYGQKTVTLAQLDGVTWYSPTDIPLNTQLIDFNAVLTGYTVSNGNVTTSEAWDCVTDYTPIDPTMTFSFKCRQYAEIGFYDKDKNPISIAEADAIKESAEDYVAFGYLTPSIIPLRTAYVVLCGNAYGVEDTLSLIRTA